MKKIILLIFIFVISISYAYALDWSGYYEGQVTGFSLHDSVCWQLSNRLRLDLSADLGQEATVTADVIALTYKGYTTFNLLDVLPAEQVETIRQLFGSGADETFSFQYDENSITLDNAFVTVYSGPFTFRLGRQQLPWGTGYAWNPTDVFNVKNLLDPTYEKPGQDALKVEWGFGPAGGITLVLMPGVSWQDFTRVGRGKIHIGGFDISISAIGQVYDALDPLSSVPQTRETRFIYGGDFVGQLFGWGVWAEGAWFDGPGDHESWQMVVGMDTTFAFQTSLMLEYFRDSDGEASPDDYTLSDWLQLGLGERRTLGRDYAMVMLSHPLTALLTGTVLVVGNLNDQSAVFVPTLEYSYSDNLTLSLTTNIFCGPSRSEYGGLKGNSGYLRIRAYF